MVEALRKISQDVATPNTGAINNSFVNNKGYLLFRMSADVHSFHTRQNFACGLFRSGILDHAAEGWVVLFRCVCSTYATLCRGPGLRTRPRLTKLLGRSTVLSEDKPKLACGRVDSRAFLAKIEDYCGRDDRHKSETESARSSVGFGRSADQSLVARNRERPDRQEPLPRRLPSALLLFLLRLPWLLRQSSRLPWLRRSASHGPSRD